MSAATHTEIGVRKAPAYRGFPATVVKTTQLSPTSLRITFTGDDLTDFVASGADQRINIIFPLPDGGVAAFPHFIDDSWYQFWRALPETQRNPMRTYTVRAARPETQEIDVDFAIDPAAGPATIWAATSQPGDSVVIIGPNRRYDGAAGGVEWRPDPQARRLLLVGDETAAPAICAILEGLELRSGQEVTAVIEVPTAADMLDGAAPAGASLTWLPREGAKRGDHLIKFVQSIAPQFAQTAGTSTGHLDEIDVDTEPLWEPAVDGRDEDLNRSAMYGWVAGEAKVVKSLRRYLVRDLGMDRRQVSFLGYWRLGRRGIQ